MKIYQITYLITFAIILNSQLAFSQLSDKKWDLMLVREDKVYLSMTQEYEASLTDLKNFLTEKNVTSFNYFTHMQDDYFFTHVTPIHQLKDLSKGIQSFMAKEVKDPELDLILDYLNESIEFYKYYIVQYQPELSYIPKGDDWGNSSPYRRWNYFYFQPGSEMEVETILFAWKKLYQKNEIDAGFRVFSGFLGVEQPLYLLTTWAENPLDYHQNLQNASSGLGEEGAALWVALMEYAKEVKTIEGWLLPQYSYAPGLELAR